MIKSEQDRYWLRGWGIVAAAKLGTRQGMGRDDADYWLAHLCKLPIKDAEAEGMIGALYSAGALPREPKRILPLAEPTKLD